MATFSNHVNVTMQSIMPRILQHKIMKSSFLDPELCNYLTELH